MDPDPAPYQHVMDPENCMEQTDDFLIGLTGIAVLGILDNTDSCVLI